MSQQELKQIACTAAYQLMSALCQIQDGDFVDGVLSAVSSNDEIMLINLCTKNKPIFEKVINITLIEANKKIIERYGNSVPQIVSYEEDDGTIWYRFFYYDGIEMMWDGFESVEEAFLSLCKFIERR